MSIPHIPWTLRGEPARAAERLLAAAAPPPARPNATPACQTCAVNARLKAQVLDRNSRLVSEVEHLKAEVERLEGEIQRQPPTAREWRELRERAHRLAEQQAAAQAEVDNTSRDLAKAIKERDSALRTIDNLHARIKRLGHTP